MPELYCPLADGDLSLEPLSEAHREALRAACAEDLEIWEIYPVSYLDDQFDLNFKRMMEGDWQRQPYAVFLDEKLVGMTAWIAHGAPDWSIEIGNSYIVPRLRGTGLNGRLKRLMLHHAFACGLRRVAFKVDEINERSKAAVMKLGCTKEGTMRAERITWTGRVRDTALFSILADEWKERTV